MREALADQVRGSDSLAANCCNKFANASKNFAIKNPPAEAGGLGGLGAGWPQSPHFDATVDVEAEHQSFIFHAFQNHFALLLCFTESKG